MVGRQKPQAPDAAYSILDKNRDAERIAQQGVGVQHMCELALGTHVREVLMVHTLTNVCDVWCAHW